MHCWAECSRTDLVNTSPVENNQGMCSALINREGFFDFLVYKTLLNVSHNVVVVCQHKTKVKLVFNNSMSDIKVSLVDGFHSMQVSLSCDPGCFMVSDMCITFYLCPNCTNKHTAHEQCQTHGGQLAYHVLKNVTVTTPGNMLDTQTKLSLFWSMFHHLEDMKASHRNTIQFGVNDHWSIHQKNCAVNHSNLCVAFNGCVTL